MLVLHVPLAITPATTAADFLLGWQLEPLPLLVLLTLGGLYCAGWRRLGARAAHREPWRAALFAAAWLALGLALLAPLHTFADELFAVHMLQHLLLIAIAPPLLLLANPMPVVVWGLSPGLRERATRALAPEGSITRLLRVLTRPTVAWPLFVVDLWLWHLPLIYQAALASEPVHYLEHLLFFGTAVLFWWPVIGPAPLRSRLGYPLRILYVFLAWLPNSLLGAIIALSGWVFMPFYAARPRHWGLDPLADQQLAGLIMWIPGDLIFAAAIFCLFLALLRQEDRREARSTAAPEAVVATRDGSPSIVR